MWGKAYWGKSYFGGAYWGPNGAAPPPPPPPFIEPPELGGGGGWVADAKRWLDALRDADSEGIEDQKRDRAALRLALERGFGLAVETAPEVAETFVEALSEVVRFDAATVDFGPALESLTVLADLLTKLEVQYLIEEQRRIEMARDEEDIEAILLGII